LAKTRIATTADEKSGEKSDELVSFKDIPPPVLAAAKSGMEVWELQSWFVSESQDSFSPLESSLYVVLDGNELRQLFNKTHERKGSLSADLKKRDRETIQWSETTINLERRNDTSILRIDWSFDRESKHRFTITAMTTTETKVCIARTIWHMTAVIDEQVGKGNWKGDETIHVTYQGSLANVPDKDESKTLKGGIVVPVKARE
jgi:hypothetical protein